MSVNKDVVLRYYVLTDYKRKPVTTNRQLLTCGVMVKTTQKYYRRSTWSRVEGRPWSWSRSPVQWTRSTTSHSPIPNSTCHWNDLQMWIVVQLRVSHPSYFPVQRHPFIQPGEWLQLREYLDSTFFRPKIDYSVEGRSGRRGGPKWLLVNRRLLSTTGDRLSLTVHLPAWSPTDVCWQCHPLTLLILVYYY